MLKRIAPINGHSENYHNSAERGGHLSSRQSLEQLLKSIPHVQALLITSMPRGGLQICQPAKVNDEVLKAYSRDLHTKDALTWQAIESGRTVVVEHRKSPAAFETGEFLAELLPTANIGAVAVVPLEGPVFAGYAGALHLYRSEEQGGFSQAELSELKEVAHGIDEQAQAQRATKRCASDDSDPWVHQLPVKQFIFNRSLKVQLNEAGWSDVESRLADQILSHARQRLGQVTEPVTSDRLMLPDSRGDVWTFRVTIYEQYPALGPGPFAFYCLQPECQDWCTLRASDFIADSELTRLIPAMQFMREGFHRGPTLHEIAKVVHLSPFHFHRRFTELFGITPKHFLLECQINQAKASLAAGEKDLVDIARSCGFAHQSHFTSRFKQATGLTPTRWRRVAAAMEQVS